MRSAIKKKLCEKVNIIKLVHDFVLLYIFRKQNKRTHKKHKIKLCMINIKGRMIYAELMKCNMSEMNNYL